MSFLLKECIEQKCCDANYTQVWSNLDDPSVLNLLEKNFKIIISNSDVMYLDCGYESWVGVGNNWCSPYSGWQDIYANDFGIFDAHKTQILGDSVVPSSKVISFTL